MLIAIDQSQAGYWLVSSFDGPRHWPASQNGTRPWWAGTCPVDTMAPRAGDLVWGLTTPSIALLSLVLNRPFPYRVFPCCFPVLSYSTRSTLGPETLSPTLFSHFTATSSSSLELLHRRLSRLPPHNVSLLRPLITPGQAGRHLVEGNAPPLRVQPDVSLRRRRPDVVLSTSLLSHRLRRWQAVPGQRAQGLGCPHDPVNVESKLEVVQSINKHKTKPEKKIA